MSSAYWTRIGKIHLLEEIAPRHPSSSRSDRSNRGGRIHFHGPTPFGNTTIVINSGGHQSNPRQSYNDNADIGTFFQTVLGQIVGGPQFPL
jgi:hypothetical protein